MVVSKKTGKKEEFDISKVRRSIANAGSDCDIMLTESDLLNVCRMIENTMKAMEKEETSSYEIFGLVVFKLRELNYTEVVHSYIRGALGITK